MSSHEKLKKLINDARAEAQQRVTRLELRVAQLEQRNAYLLQQHREVTQVIIREYLREHDGGVSVDFPGQVEIGLSNASAPIRVSTAAPKITLTVNGREYVHGHLSMQSISHVKGGLWSRPESLHIEKLFEGRGQS